ncbi:response regulator [Limnoglobus roseus]|uniref:Response regulator n=1 Tax=Limnoglobus roseus TaxID=2598579 RepID=A0A5C1ARA1_9BACT|nr:response regulator [Limnoglobus roseus]QEL20506.1 response regulator [Limnoglobus roseus]
MKTERLRVLCVDDNHDVADSEVLLLELFGIEARACYDGACALAEARQFHPDAYLVDLNMPGMDGCELARELRTGQGPPPFLVAVTAKSGKEDYRRTAEAGFDAHLVKPVTPDHLLAVLFRTRASEQTPPA